MYFPGSLKPDLKNSTVNTQSVTSGHKKIWKAFRFTEGGKYLRVFRKQLSSKYSGGEHE